MKVAFMRFLAALFLLLGIAGVSPAGAQITVDPATAVEAAGSSITMNHTVSSASSRYLIVSVAIERDDAAVASVTYAGQALSLLGKITDPGAGATLEVWGRVAPASGTNQVVVTLGNSAAVVVGAISFANVDQTSPISASQFASGSIGLVASASVLSATDQLVFAAIAANDSVIAVVPGLGQTSRWNVMNFADVIGAASTKPVSATSTTMSYTLSGLGGWGMGLFALQPADPLIVTNTNDSGGGSLRAAIEFANSNPGADTITFNIPGAGPHTITVASLLPTLTDSGTVIDGTTQSGTQCRDLWAGNGHDLRVNVRGGGFNGFQLAGTNQTIRGLSLTGFENAIIALASSSTATVQCNYLGLLANGSSSANSRGVLVRGASALIGGLDAGQGNVISANSIVALVTEAGSANTAIRGNFIGTDPTGMNARANFGGINNFFGTATWRDITHNLISGNGNRAAIMLESDDNIQPSTDTIRIQRNVIGFNRTLSSRLPNGTDHAAIWFSPGSISNVLIGGVQGTEGNAISASRDGIVLQGVSNIQVKGNIIARTGLRGIWVGNSSNVTIGGVAATEGNRIGGSGNDAIRLLANSTGVSILGNLIQPVTITGATYANVDHGIWLENSSNVTIGDGTANGRNVIAGNGSRAILGTGTVSGLTINGNFIGTDESGNAAVTNGTLGASVSNDAMVIINAAITNLSVLNNVIGGYQAALVTVWASNGTGITLRGNNIGVGADGSSPITSANIEPLIHVGGGSALSDLLIGGNGAGEGNIVAFGGNAGIQLNLSSGSSQIAGNTIRDNAEDGVRLLNTTSAAIIANSIFANGGLGIDLGNDGVTPNDAGDGDAGPNDFLNFPVINSIVPGSGNTLTYDFNLDVPANGDGYRVDFYKNTSADPTGHGEGEIHLGFVEFNHAGGDLNFTGTLSANAPIGVADTISATATRRTATGYDITSEFAQNATAELSGQLTVEIVGEVYGPAALGQFNVPQNDRLMTATVSNETNAATSTDSIFLIIDVPAEAEFFNGDVDDAGSETDPVAFDGTNAPELTFNYSSDVRYSDAVSRPAFADCNYAPAAGHDPNVRFVCVNPKGTLGSGDPDPSFAVRFRQRIR